MQYLRPCVLTVDGWEVGKAYSRHAFPNSQRGELYTIIQYKERKRPLQFFFKCFVCVLNHNIFKSSPNSSVNVTNSGCD